MLNTVYTGIPIWRNPKQALDLWIKMLEKSQIPIFSNMGIHSPCTPSPFPNLRQDRFWKLDKNLIIFSIRVRQSKSNSVKNAQKVPYTFVHTHAHKSSRLFILCEYESNFYDIFKYGIRVRFWLGSLMKPFSGWGFMEKKVGEKHRMKSLSTWKSQFLYDHWS